MGMRKWTLDERGRICLDDRPYWWTLPEADELRQFIVDALNAAEERAGKEAQIYRRHKDGSWEELHPEPGPDAWAAPGDEIIVSK